MLSRRHFIAGSALSIATPSIVRAQGWQGKTITLIVPFAAGGGTDSIGRIIAEDITNTLGRQVVVENRPGAGSNIGIESASRAEPDGNTILIASIGFAINRFLYRNPGWDPINDFDPISFIGFVPNVMAVPNSSPAKSVAEFIAYAKSQPGKLTYASAGVGSSLHLCAELFQRVAKIEMVHVPYRGSAPALQDVMAGRVDCIFDVLTAINPQVQGGTLRGLAVTSAKRIKASGDLPTVAESGLPDFDFATWFGMFAPKKTPKDVINTISQAVQKATKTATVKEKLEKIGVDVVGSDPDALSAHVKKELARWEPIIRGANIQPQ
ncbi:MAG: tripartite tricarboxylate transporter substrate binding protein [Rhizobiales bacterium]|nr:tripartite tricarboxylate transporter substrate binding protein [Hyphomicrobiales bacterium]